METFLIALLESYFLAIRKYMDFSGRSDRVEFWMFALCNFIIGIVFAILSKIPILGVIVRIISVLYSLAILVPSLAVGTRRLHDTNRSGFFLFLALIPFVGIVVVLILCALEGTPGDNKYGPDPKELC
jgi:uncharacterized membrane protein YhaH (DUF805 family)